MDSRINWPAAAAAEKKDPLSEPPEAAEAFGTFVEAASLCLAAVEEPEQQVDLRVPEADPVDFGHAAMRNERERMGQEFSFATTDIADLRWSYLRWRCSAAAWLLLFFVAF